MATKQLKKKDDKNTKSIFQQLGNLVKNAIEAGNLDWQKLKSQIDWDKLPYKIDDFTDDGTRSVGPYNKVLLSEISRQKKSEASDTFRPKTVKGPDGEDYYIVNKSVYCKALVNSGNESFLYTSSGSNLNMKNIDSLSAKNYHVYPISENVCFPTLDKNGNIFYTYCKQGSLYLYDENGDYGKILCNDDTNYDFISDKLKTKICYHGDYLTFKFTDIVDASRRGVGSNFTPQPATDGSYQDVFEKMSAYDSFDTLKVDVQPAKGFEQAADYGKAVQEVSKTSRRIPNTDLSASADSSFEYD